MGRRINRSAANAASMANALNQPNRRSDGKSERTVTTNPQASTTDVRIKGRTNKHGCPLHSQRGVLVRRFLLPQPVQEMNGSAQAQSEGHRQRHDAG